MSKNMILHGEILSLSPSLSLSLSLSLSPDDIMVLSALSTPLVVIMYMRCKCCYDTSMDNVATVHAIGLACMKTILLTQHNNENSNVTCRPLSL